MLQQIRHQCLIYDGSPMGMLPALATMTRQKLNEKYRCVYLNRPEMVNNMRAALTSAGVDAVSEERDGNLILSSDQSHLVDGCFDIDRMMSLLGDGLAKALRDGFRGLWATGDMSWELGTDCASDKLLDYEWRLEEFFRHNPALCGVCQYHVDTLPPSTVRAGLVSHPALFINETLLRINSHYVSPEVFSHNILEDPILDGAITELCQSIDEADVA